MGGGGGGSGTSNRHRPGARAALASDRRGRWANDERDIVKQVQVNNGIQESMMGNGVIASKGREHGVRVPKRMADGGWQMDVASAIC